MPPIRWHNDPKAAAVMAVVDRLNAECLRNAVSVAVVGMLTRWAAKF